MLTPVDDPHIALISVYKSVGMFRTTYVAVRGKEAGACERALVFFSYG